MCFEKVSQSDPLAMALKTSERVRILIKKSKGLTKKCAMSITAEQKLLMALTAVDNNEDKLYSGLGLVFFTVNSALLTS